MVEGKIVFFALFLFRIEVLCIKTPRMSIESGHLVNLGTTHLKNRERGKK